MPSRESLRARIASAAVVAARSQKTCNVVIGFGRSVDPNPQVEQSRPHFAVRIMSFDGGFAKDRASLAGDLYSGERRALKIAGSYNGKTTVCA